MNKRSSAVLLVIAIILILSMICVSFYSNYISPISFKYPLIFGLGTVSLALINILNYSENEKASAPLMIALAVIAAAFVMTLIKL